MENLNNQKPVLLIVDNKGDEQVYRMLIASKLENPVIITKNSIEEVFEYIKSDNPKPGLIISDIDISENNKLKLFREMHKGGNIRDKRTPFLFISPSSSTEGVIFSYNTSIHCCFQKGNDYEEFVTNFSTTIDYWEKWIDNESRNKSLRYATI